MLRKLISMARSVEEIKDAASPLAMEASKYDWGLTLRFSQETLEKLNLDTDDVEVGDLLHMICMAEVTSVSKHDSGDGERCCVELQLTHIGIENESTEYMDEAE